jgi:hypothetical protein
MWSRVFRWKSLSEQVSFRLSTPADGILDDALVRAREFLKRQPVRAAVVDSAQVARQKNSTSAVGSVGRTGATMERTRNHGPHQGARLMKRTT